MEDEDYDSNVVVPQHHCHCNQREYNLRRNKRRSDRRHQIIDSKSGSWLDLPHELLAAILHHLPTADLVTISAVCRTWRSHAAEAISARPPLLLIPVQNTPQGKWCDPPRCILRDITTLNSCCSFCWRPYYSMVDSHTLHEAWHYAAYSFGQLIVGNIVDVVLADVFSGRVTLCPKYNDCFSAGILTAPPSSASCRVLLVAHGRGEPFVVPSSIISCWQIASGVSEGWSVLVENGMEIVSLVVFKDEVFALDRQLRLMTMEFAPTLQLKLLGVRLKREVERCIYHAMFCYHLAECNGELLLVLFVYKEWKFQVYRLDWDRSEWVEVRSLGNWCLFIDGKTKCSMACSEPTRWGGRNNCIYLAAAGLEGRDLSVFPLDDNQLIHDGFSSLLFTFKWDIFKWPLPIWVSPSISGGPAIGDRSTK